MKELTFVPGDLLLVNTERTYVWKTDRAGDPTRWPLLDGKIPVIYLPLIVSNDLRLSRCLTQFGIGFVATDQLKRD